MRKRQAGETGAPAPEPVVALARGLAVLRAFRRGDAGLGNQDIALRTGLARSTVSRLTQSLLTLGYLDYSADDGRYRLGAATLALGFSALGGMSIREIARPVLQEVANRFGCSVGLAAPDGMRMVYIDHCHGHSPLQIGMETGAQFRLATSAAGRAVFAGLSVDERKTLCAALLEQSDEPVALQATLAGVLEDYVRDGYVQSLSEWQPEVNSVAAPIRLPGGRIYAVNCASSALVLRDNVLSEAGRAVARACREIEFRLSGR